MTDFVIKQNDTLPDLTATLVETPKGGSAEPIDLSDATKVQLVARLREDKDPTPPKIKADCTIISPSLGKVQYHWIPEDTDTSGEFFFEFEITWASGDPQTVPREGYYILDIEDDLG